MWTMRKFWSSPTRLASVVMSTAGLFLYAISPPDDTWFCVGSIAIHVVPVIVVVMIYEICSIRQAQGRARNASFSYVISYDAFDHRAPSSGAFSTRRRLQELRLQIALLDREIYEFQNYSFGVLPSFNLIRVPVMHVEEINAFPVYNYKGTGLEIEDAPLRQASSSSASAQEYQTIGITEDDGSSDDLICNICLDEVMRGELVRRLPCFHQFHPGCIDKWLGLNASCPICKIVLGSGRMQTYV